MAPDDLAGSGLDPPLVGHAASTSNRLERTKRFVPMGWGLALRGVKEAFAPFELARTPLPDDLLEDQLGTVLARASGTRTALRISRPVSFRTTTSARLRRGTE